MSNQYVICPNCGAQKDFTDWTEIFDRYGVSSIEEYSECRAYKCNECEEDFTATIYYTLKFEKIVQNN